jgi:hypothetical protein
MRRLRIKIHFVGKPEWGGWNGRKAGTALGSVHDYSLPYRSVRRFVTAIGSLSTGLRTRVQVELSGVVLGHKIIVWYAPLTLGCEVRCVG